MAEVDARVVSVALAFLRSKHDYRTLTLDADLVRGVIQRATERAVQGDDVVDERLKQFREMHRNTIEGVERLFTDEEMAQGREDYGNDNQSWVGMMACVVHVMRGGDTAADLRGDAEHYEELAREAERDRDRYAATLREIMAGREDAANLAAEALAGCEVAPKVVRMGSVYERLSRERVWCHVCGKERELNMYRALNYDEWPECCGKPTGIDSPAERQAENSL